MGTRTLFIGFSGWRKGRWWIAACNSFPWLWEDQAAGGRLYEN